MLSGPLICIIYSPALKEERSMGSLFFISLIGIKTLPAMSHRVSLISVPPLIISVFPEIIISGVSILFLYKSDGSSDSLDITLY